MAGTKEHMAKMRAARKKKPPASQASRFADDARRQLQPRREVETPLMYARRMAGWPPLKG